MRVTKTELGPILNGGHRQALLPANPHLPTPSGRDRLHRRNGGIVAYVKITEAELIGPLDEVIDDQFARQAGHPTADAYRDEWCRTHDAAWTGETAWLVTFTLEPHREAHRAMRGPWDPGDETRRRAPEPEKVDSRPFAADARARWERDQAQREALYRAMPLAEKVRRAVEDARAAGVDTSLLEKSIERRVESLRSKTRRNAA